MKERSLLESNKSALEAEIIGYQFWGKWAAWIKQLDTGELASESNFIEVARREQNF